MASKIKDKELYEAYTSLDPKIRYQFVSGELVRKAREELPDNLVVSSLDDEELAAYIYPQWKNWFLSSKNIAVEIQIANYAKRKLVDKYRKKVGL